MAEECGVDMMNLSIGFYTFAEVVPTQYSEEAPYVYMSEKVKEVVNIPVAIVGKLRTPSLCAKIIEDNKADFVCVGRQLICDPEWANKILHGKEDTIRTCLNCLEGCMERMSFADSGIRCVINPYVGFEDLYNENNVPEAGNERKILVVGGGIAGMQFSIIASKMDHDVILAEKGDRLGGQMILAGMTPFKKEVEQALEWFVGETNRCDIDVRLNTNVDLDYIKEVNPDIVVLAMGCEFATPPIEGIEYSVRGDDAIARKVEIGAGKNVAVIGGGVAGCELAHRIALEGSNVTVLEMLPEVCGTGAVIHSTILKTHLQQCATVLTSVKVTKVTENSVTYVDAENNETTIDVDVVVNCAGQKKVSTPLYNALLEAGIETYKIGEHGTSNFQNATREAFQLAYSL